MSAPAPARAAVRHQEACEGGGRATIALRAGAGRSAGGFGGEDGLTLERQLGRVWEGLHAAEAAECPVCAGSMARSDEAVGGYCRDCGSSLT